MRKDPHRYAEQLILKSAVEPLAPADSAWLRQHLADCADCVHRVEETERVIDSLRTFSVAVDPLLVERTRAKVRLRAGVLAQRKSKSGLLWASCAATWAWMALSAPHVWRAFAWLGGRAGVPAWAWEMGFGLWWFLPALALGASLVYYRSSGNAAGAVGTWNG
jgi:anti-sigma factor RsiW